MRADWAGVVGSAGALAPGAGEVVALGGVACWVAAYPNSALTKATPRSNATAATYLFYSPATTLEHLYATPQTTFHIHSMYSCLANTTAVDRRAALAARVVDGPVYAGAQDYNWQLRLPRPCL